MSDKQVSDHYDSAYFDWQRPLGEFAGWANRFKFAPWVSDQTRLIDFGCGGGFLLEQLPATERLGVEPNPAARAAGVARGLQIVESIDHVDDGWADVIISEHALEHTLNPLEVLKSLRPKLRPRGRLVFVVPCESHRRAFASDDVNHHLYTWSPMNLGHLMLEAGYCVERVEVIWHRFPPLSGRIWRLRFGHRVMTCGDGILFTAAARVWSRFDRQVTQVRAVAIAD